MLELDLLIAESDVAAARVSDVAEAVDVVCLDAFGWRARIEARSTLDRVALAVDRAADLPALTVAAGYLRAAKRAYLLVAGDAETALLAETIAVLARDGWGVADTDTLQTNGHVVIALSLDRDADAGDGNLAAVAAITANPSALVSGLGVLGGRVGGLRVGFVGGVGLGLLGGVVRSVVVESSWVGSLGEVLGGWLDVLVVDEGVGGFSSGDVVGLIGEARGLGASVVGVSVSGGDVVWSGLVDVVVGVDGSVVDGSGLVVAPSVDVRVVNPVGYVRVDGGRFAVVGSVSPFRDGFDGLVGLVGGLAGSVGVDVLDVAGVGGGVSWPGGVSVVDVGGVDVVGLVGRLRGYVGVVDHPALHGGVVERASWLVSLAAAGVPVVVEGMSDELVGLLGDELVAVLGSVSVEGLLDAEVRDRVSVELRRVALRVHSRVERWVVLAGRLGIPVWDVPRVSVVLATNRPEYVEFAVGQVGFQSYPNCELVLVLHGDGFEGFSDEGLAGLVDLPTTVLRPPADLSYGEVLNLGVEASSGVLVAKMDDDDWYGVEHIWDLVLAMEYSGATLVGKGAEFVYLEELDITIRRLMGTAETNSTTIASGSFLIPRDKALLIGGWRRISFAEDRALISDVMLHGMATYRTHPYGYLLNRRAAGHAWSMTTDYFTSRASTTVDGVARGWAGT